MKMSQMQERTPKSESSQKTKWEKYFSKILILGQSLHQSQ